MSYLGSSLTVGRTHVRRWLAENCRGRDARVAEFGVGRGKYGETLRSAMPDATIIGCDGYEEAVKHHLDGPSPYDHVWHMPATEFACSSHVREFCDVWAFGDVLEHFPEESADFILRKADELRVEHVVLSIPVGPWPQAPHPKNPLEEHQWTFYPSKLVHWPAWEVVIAAVVSSNRFKGPNRREYFDTVTREEYALPEEFLGHFVLRRARAAR